VGWPRARVHRARGERAFANVRERAEATDPRATTPRMPDGSPRGPRATPWARGVHHGDDVSLLTLAVVAAALVVLSRLSRGRRAAALAPVRGARGVGRFVHPEEKRR